MGMSTRCVGFRPADEKWEKMKAAWKACVEVGAPVPTDVANFFGSEDPGDKPGMEVDLGDAVSEYKAEMVEGYEIDVTKLPPDVKIVRVYNSW